MHCKISLHAYGICIRVLCGYPTYILYTLSRVILKLAADLILAIAPLIVQSPIISDCFIREY